MSSDLDNILIGELTTETDAEIINFTESLVKKLSSQPLGILFYGSVLRNTDYNGILDFYVITEKTINFSNSLLGRVGNKLLPPNVYYIEESYKNRTIRAKVAVLSYNQFLQRSTLDSRDTTIWARFCQPVRLVWVRDPDAADNILKAARQSVITASCWAALLGPHSGTAEDYWHSLFARTYKAELRVEKKNRSKNLLEKNEERYKDVLLLSWEKASLGFETSGCVFRPHLSATARQKAQKKWSHIEEKGKFLNVARLLKAAFTFSDGITYLLWKINRHTGQEIIVSSFERKHPVLGLPVLLWRLRKVRGFLKK